MTNQRLYLVEHTTSDFNRFCIVMAATADEAKRVAKKTNYDPLWRKGYDKFRLIEFTATPIDKIVGMETGCSITFG